MSSYFLCRFCQIQALKLYPQNPSLTDVIKTELQSDLISIKDQLQIARIHFQTRFQNFLQTSSNLIKKLNQKWK